MRLELSSTQDSKLKRRRSREMAATGLGGAAALSPLLLLATCSSNTSPPSLLPPSSPLLTRSPPSHRRSSLSSSSSSSSSSSFQACCLRSPNPSSSSLSRTTHRFFPLQLPLPISSTHPHLLCRAAEYKFPDPIPEFADAETDKFRTHMLGRLTEKNQYFGDFVEEIVDICAEILSNFLHAEYGGPGTLLVIPFIDMADTIREKELPGAPQAARAAVWWAEKHIDKDWKEWTGHRD